MDKKRNAVNIASILGVAVMLLVTIWILTSGSSVSAVKYSDLIQYFQDEKVTEYAVDFNSGKVTMILDESVATGTEKLPAGVKRNSNQKLEINYNVASIKFFREDIKPYVDAYNLKHPQSQMIMDYKPAQENILLSLLPTIIMIGLMVFAFWFMMKRLNSSIGESNKQMNFGKAKVKKLTDEKRKTTFADVAGADEEKEELREIVDFLKNPTKYNELGARIPKGVLLIGPPGTGKTLLARAVAGEAGVPFFSISGSDFVEMFVGVGASRVRDLFEQAKKNHPCIIFIDEIDAVGRQRGAGLGGGHDEREQTLNQLLVEMDGFGSNEGVIMIAATNRPDILDPALMRPGRFDRQVTVNYPDVKGREEILKVHAKGKPLGPDVDLKTIARATAGFTGADLENLLNEAALLSARRNILAITKEEIEESTIKVIAGTEKKSHVVADEDKKITAYHEAGHAVVSHFLPSQDPVHQVSIIPRGMAAGYTLNLPVDDKQHVSKTYLYEEIVLLLGGRAAEFVALDDICTGASNDIERATEISRSMVMKYGMSKDLGPILYGSKNEEVFLGRDMGHDRNYSENIAAKIDNEVHEMITTAYEKAIDILKNNRDKLELVAKKLLENEKIDGAEFKELMQQA